MDSFEPPNMVTKSAVQDSLGVQKSPDFTHASPQDSLNPNTPHANPYQPIPYYPHYSYPLPASFMPRPTPYDPSTPFSRWFKSTDAFLSQLSEAYKTSALITVLPKDTRLRLQLRGITEISDYDSVKSTLLNLMRVTKKPKSALDLFRRRQMPGESFVQFAMAL
ncbi:unnamed protein product [Hymenolepis diminuta]|uniref:Uncharacterized protein n=1 Tax=Hymenolepis diminuta TaxID=6216 RepID=A0A564YL62_HYMDI|nr:unnamed protein product [Hymenolepis diminuta]